MNKSINISLQLKNKQLKYLYQKIMKNNRQLHNRYSYAFTILLVGFFLSGVLSQQVCPVNQIGQTCETFAPDITNKAVVSNLTANGNYSYFYYQPPFSQTFQVQVQICMQKILDSNGNQLNQINGFNIIFIELQMLNGSFYEYPVGGSGRTFPSKVNKCEYLWTYYTDYRMKTNGQVQRLIVAIKYQTDGSSDSAPVYEQIIIQATGEEYYNPFAWFYIPYYIFFMLSFCLFCTCLGWLAFRAYRGNRGGTGAAGIELNANNDPLIVDNQYEPPFMGQPVQIGGANANQANQANNNISAYQSAQQGYQADSRQVQPVAGQNQRRESGQADRQNENDLL